MTDRHIGQLEARRKRCLYNARRVGSLAKRYYWQHEAHLLGEKIRAIRSDFIRAAGL